MTKHVLGRVLLVLLGIGVACVGAEVVVRVLDLPPRMLRPLDPGV